MSRNSTISIAHTRAKRVLILNYKGGVGKSTLSVNLLNKLFLAKSHVEVIDTDKQASTYHWAKKISGIRAQHISFQHKSYTMIASSVRVNRNSQLIVIDSPANFDDSQIKKYLMITDCVLIPIQPSPVDLHASLPFIEKVISGIRVLRKEVDIGFVVNRVNSNARSTNRVVSLLSNFRQYRTLGLMKESEIYQKPFLKLGLVEHTQDSELWQNLFNWLQVKPYGHSKNNFSCTKQESPAE